MGCSLPGGLSRHLWAGSLSEGPNLGCFLSRAGHLWRLPQACLGPGRLLGDPGLHQRFLLPAHILARHYRLHQRCWRPRQHYPLLASLGAPCQDELLHLPDPPNCHEHCEQLCQLQGERQPGISCSPCVFNLSHHQVLIIYYLIFAMSISIAISYALIVLFEVGSGNISFLEETRLHTDADYIVVFHLKFL